MYPRKKLSYFYQGEMKPFKIIDNLYYVGSYKECCHMVDTGDGLLLIDVGNIGNVYLIINSIYQLGFSPYDVKHILLTHRLGNHCWNNDLDNKCKLITEDYNPFLDNGKEWIKFLTYCKERALKICKTDTLELEIVK